jgi:hypothetical protein
MTQNTHDDEFSYDDTPSGGAQTFTDEQPSGGAPGGGDKYAALSGIPAGTGEPTGPAKCMGPFTEARIITKEGTTYVAIKLVVATSDRPEVAPGSEHELFGPVLGGDQARRSWHLKDLQALAKKAGAKWDPSSLAGSLKALDAVARTGKQVAFTLKPGTRGGTFVNV